MHWTKIAVGVLTLAATVTVPATAGAAATTVACVATMSVVAHEDDDLLFINPEISDDIAAGRCVTTVYVTSGDAGRGPDYWRGREWGEMAAYARMAARPARWTEDTLILDGHAIHRATLDGTGITLLFLRLPDRVGGWPDQTLQMLWLDPAARVRTLDPAARVQPLDPAAQVQTLDLAPRVGIVDPAPRVGILDPMAPVHTLDPAGRVDALGAGRAYTRKSLLGVLVSVFAAYQPRIIRTLDFRHAYGDGDHDDHHSAAYFTHAAQQRYRTPHQTVGHLGYQASDHPANLTPAQYDTKLAYFLTYAPHDRVVCQAVDWCTRGNYGRYVRRNIRVGAPIGAGRNVAAQSTVTASSGNTATVQVPAKAVDGRLSATLIGEWATVRGRAGAWLNLRWPAPQRLDRVVLHDRPNRYDRVTAGVLRFSDGTTVRVGALPDGGAPLTVRFTPRTITGLRFTVTRVSRTTRNTGLAEIRTITAG